MDYLVRHLIDNIISVRIMSVWCRYYSLSLQWIFGKFGERLYIYIYI